MIRDLQNERGQATTAALVILPVMLSACCALLVLSYALMYEARATAACRSALMENQSKAAEAINKLLALNPRAELMEKSVKCLKVAVRTARASGIVPAIIFAEAALVSAEAIQQETRAEQLWWLGQGKLAASTAVFRASKAVADSLPAGFFSNAMMNSFSLPKFKQAMFKVIASPPHARTPTYRTAPDFEESQKAAAQWLLEVNANETAIDNYEPFHPKIRLGCAAQLTKQRGGEWTAQLTEDKLIGESRSW